MKTDEFRWVGKQVVDSENHYLGEMDDKDFVPSRYLLQQNPILHKKVSEFVNHTIRNVT
jgi:hypothetical protein